MEDPGRREASDERVRLPRPRRRQWSAIALAAGGFLLGAVLSGSFWGGVAAGALALLLWRGAWTLRG